MRSQKNNLASVGDARRHQFIVLVDANGDNTAGHHVAEILERRLLTVPFCVVKKMNLPSSSSRAPAE